MASSTSGAPAGGSERDPDAYYSKAQAESFQSVEQADGAIDTAVAALSHPSVIAHSVIESAPLLLSAAIGGAVGLTGRAAVIAGAASEGLTQAGSAAEQSQTRKVSPVAGQEPGTLTVKQAALAASSGVVTGALGALGGRVAQRLGIADVETMLAGRPSMRRRNGAWPNRSSTARSRKASSRSCRSRSPNRCIRTWPTDAR